MPIIVSNTHFLLFLPYQPFLPYQHFLFLVSMSEDHDPCCPIKFFFVKDNTLEFPKNKIEKDKLQWKTLQLVFYNKLNCVL